MSRTIIVAGGGPAGLSFARALAGSPHRVVLVEPQPREVLAAPPPDGREIALTRRSEKILHNLGVWQEFPPDEVFPLREARVRNGASPFAMAIGPERGDALGNLVPSHQIRAALFKTVARQSNVELHTGRKVSALAMTSTRAEATLDDGTRVTGDLLIAADSRFSQLREKLGIGAYVTRFGHTMMVCRIAHSLPHNGISTEWFDHGRTIALLPLAEGQSGLVVTLPDDRAAQVMALNHAGLETEFAGYLGGDWGEVSLLTRPHAYPLAMTYAERFTAPRAALIGDTAVGMHPVTAHGFNFGLLGAWRLASLVGHADDPGAAHLLTRWALQHRLATMPLYEGTRQLVKLYTDERTLVRPVRAGMLRLGSLPPVRRILGKLLSEAEPA